MEAIREIADIQNKKLSINIPDTFRYERVEVVILPVLTGSIIEKKNGGSLRGRLRKYANKSLIRNESSAWRDAVEDTHENSGC